MTAALIYASKLGHTRAAAEYIAKEIGADIYDLKKGVPDIGRYVEVIIGSGVYAGKIPKRMRSFLDEASKYPNKVFSMFVTCSRGAGKGAEQLSKITDGMSLDASVFFSGISKDDPAGAEGMNEFVNRLKGL